MAFATDASGEYAFEDLGPGDYIVCEVLKSGWVQTFPASGDDCSFDTALGSEGHAFSGTSGTDHLNNDFGNFELVEKRGTKFEDIDGDGDIAEDAANDLEGWDIKIWADDGTDPGVLDAGDTFIETATTDADGNYEFDELGPGSFIVCEVLEPGWIQTYPVTGTADCSSDSTLGAQACQSMISDLGPIYWARKSAALNDRTKQHLDELAQIAKRCTSMVIEVHGHADATGSADVSRRLSKERALAVAKYLIAAGVEAHRLVAIGHGADAPIVTGDAQESMTCNRRIEFSLQRSEGGPKLSEILRGLH